MLRIQNNAIRQEKKIKTGNEISWRDICTSRFIAALLIRAKKWKQPKYQSNDKWIQKTVHMYKGISFGCEKEKNPVIVSTCTKLEIIMLSE
jgi:hypothetical protein